MLWYFLSPLRGTTHPPRLSASHPIRRAFYRHGKATAQNWLLTMLVSVAIAMAFSYPTVLRSSNPTAGLATYPHHVWTSVKTLNETHTNVDLEMRQIWVYGSYMEALDRSVLRKSLAIQASFVGEAQEVEARPVLSDQTTSDSLRWGFHSPLMYWNNSAQAIDADVDILKTVNEQKHLTSPSLDIILRHASVFAGKRFDRRNLLAADALVITLINRASDGIGARWQNKMTSLEQETCPGCSLFPWNGQLTRHRVFEFSFKAITFKENLALTFAYSCMAIYVLLSLSRLKAFHSRFGLVVTAITQMTFSILASFTICDLLHINLATIPQNAYPFVVLVIGLENMFRLINAILAYPPTMATDSRIANALGDIGPLSLATVAQNLTILSILSTVVSPGVAAFCAFAAIATLFDAFFLLSFFVAVLNVDIRRLELQDTIANRHQKSHRSSRGHRRLSPSKTTWFDALLSGRLPFSTRMAGTAVTTTFILSLNYHFFERREISSNLRQLLGFGHSGSPNLADFDTLAPAAVNASLTPGEWMRMQDFEAAKGVMKLARPDNGAFVMKIFAPLVVVLPGSDRSGPLHEHEAWSRALRSFTIHHFYPVAVAVVFGVAFVSVLMNFLLYNEPGVKELENDMDQTEDHLTVSTILLPHRLDIMKLGSHENGHVVSAALDRTIAVTTITNPGASTATTIIPAEVLDGLKWPVSSLAVDDSGDWIACHGADGMVLLYSHTQGPASRHLIPFPDDTSALIFRFVRLSHSSEDTLFFVALTSGGRLTMSNLVDHQLFGQDMSLVTLVGGALVHTAQRGIELLAMSEDSTLSRFSWGSRSWTSTYSRQVKLDKLHRRNAECVMIEAISDRDGEFVILSTSICAIYMDAGTLSQIAVLTPPVNHDEARHLFPGQPSRCSTCGSMEIRRFAICKQRLDDGQNVLTTWSIDTDPESGSSICLGPGTAVCTSHEAVRSVDYELGLVESWIVTKRLVVLGLRQLHVGSSSVSSGEGRGSPSSGLRKRRHARQISASQHTLEQWEAFKLVVDGDLKVHDITKSMGTESISLDSLYACTPGPIVTLSDQTAAIAFGNAIHVLQSSRHGPAGRRSRLPSLERKPSSSKKRGTVRRQK